MLIQYFVAASSRSALANAVLVSAATTTFGRINIQDDDIAKAQGVCSSGPFVFPYL
jgi:hypothetical protein